MSLYEKNLKIVQEFINDCSKHSHYEHSNFNPPERLLGWRENSHSVLTYYKWIKYEANLPSLKLNIEMPVKDISDELATIEEHFVKHRGSIHPGWESMCLHGVSVDQTDDWRSRVYEHKNYTEKPLHTWTTIAEKCPRTIEWLNDVWPNAEYDRVRFMMLRPGGYIRPHQDNDNRGMEAFNVAITNPPGVKFAMEDAGEIPWEVGDCRAIDIGRKHTVLNTSTEPRVHMIIHGKEDHPRMAKLVIESYEMLRDSLQT